MRQKAILWIKNNLVYKIICLDACKKWLGGNFKGLKLAPKDFFC